MPAAPDGAAGAAQTTPDHGGDGDREAAGERASRHVETPWGPHPVGPRDRAGTYPAATPPAPAARACTSSSARRSGGDPAVGLAHRGVMRSVDLQQGRAGDSSARARCRAGRHDGVGGGGDDGGRDVDRPEPVRRAEAAQRGADPQERRAGRCGAARGGTSRRRGPGGDLGVDGPLHAGAGQPGPGPGRRGDEVLAAEPGVGRSTAPEVAGGRAQHQPGHPGRVPVPQELGDRAPHRVADDDGPVDLDRVEHRGGVVGQVLQVDPPAHGQAPPMAPQVGGDDPVAVGEGGVREGEGRVGGDGPAVEQQHRRPVVAALAGRVDPDPGVAEAGQVEGAPGRQARWFPPGHRGARVSPRPRSRPASRSPSAWCR